MVPDDPVADEEFKEEDYKTHFEQNFNEIGNDIINFVSFLSTKLEESTEQLDQYMNGEELSDGERRKFL